MHPVGHRVDELEHVVDGAQLVQAEAARRRHDGLTPQSHRVAAALHQAAPEVGQLAPVAVGGGADRAVGRHHAPRHPAAVVEELRQVAGDRLDPDRTGSDRMPGPEARMADQSPGPAAVDTGEDAGSAAARAPDDQVDGGIGVEREARAA